MPPWKRQWFPVGEAFRRFSYGNLPMVKQFYNYRPTNDDVREFEECIFSKCVR